MPLPGGQSTQSGILYQNSVVTEFLVGLLLGEGHLQSVQVEAPEPVGDVVLRRQQAPDSYVQIKQDPSTGQWTAMRLHEQGFWLSALSQLRTCPRAEIWFVTPSSCSTLRELMDRSRQSGNLDEFQANIGKSHSKELARITSVVHLDTAAVINFIRHIYIKDSYGSTSSIEQRVRSRIQAPVGQDVFAILRDSVMRGSTAGQVFKREDVLRVLNSRGILTLRSVSETLVITDISQLSLRCEQSIRATISNVVREKYLPHLFVTRTVQQDITNTVLKNLTDLSTLLDRFASRVADCKRTLSKRHREPLSSEQIHDLEQQYDKLQEELRSVRSRLDTKQYINWHQERDDLERMISNLHDPEGDGLVRDLRRTVNNVAVVVDKAGRGKTNILCYMAAKFNKDNPVVFLTGSELRLNRASDLFQLIASVLGFDNHGETPQWLEPLNQILRIHDKYLIIVIDAVNESPDWELLKAGLERLVPLTYEYNLRLLFSCRDVFWQGYFHKANDLVSHYTSLEFSLGDFTSEEFDEVFPKYCDHFKMEATTISPDARMALRHPLLLRFFCEAYGSTFGAIVKLSPVTHIRLKRLFDDYWEKKSAYIRTRLRHRTTAEIDKFLHSLALAMLNRRNRYVPVDDLPAITGESDLQSPVSRYTAILDEDVILEQSHIGHRPLTYFTYDEFMEYMIARAKLPDLSIDRDVLIRELGEILKQRRKFPSALGVVGYISIMLKEQENVSVWWPLIAKYPSWRVTAVRSCAQLEEILWDSDVLSAINATVRVFCKRPTDRGLYEELQQFSDRIFKHDSLGSVPIWQTWLLNGPTEARLKASQRLGLLSMQGYSFALHCLLDALDCTDDDVCGTAVNALSVVQNEVVPTAMIQHMQHRSPLVRQMIAYSLGCYPPRADVRLSLLQMLRDSDLDVCLTAATSLLRDSLDLVGTSLDALSQRLQRHREIDSMRYSVIVRKMTMIWRQLHSERRSDVILKALFDGRFNQDVLFRIETLRRQLTVHGDYADKEVIGFLDALLRFGQENAQ